MYNRYVVCRAMDGKGGRDLICPEHGAGGDGCTFVAVAPVEELREVEAKLRRAERANEQLDRAFKEWQTKAEET